MAKKKKSKKSKKSAPSAPVATERSPFWAYTAAVLLLLVAIFMLLGGFTGRLDGGATWYLSH
jgi:hypothetical protein